jgi:hypothetical protein
MKSLIRFLLVLSSWSVCAGDFTTAGFAVESWLESVHKQRDYEFGEREDSFFESDDSFPRTHGVKESTPTEENQVQAETRTKILSRCDELLDNYKFSEAWDLIVREQLKEERAEYLLKKLLDPAILNWELAMDVALGLSSFAFSRAKEKILLAIGQPLDAENFLELYLNELPAYISSLDKDKPKHLALCAFLLEQKILSQGSAARLRIILSRSC